MQMTTLGFGCASTKLQVILSRAFHAVANSGAIDFNFNPTKVYNGNQNLANNQSFDYLLQLAQPHTVAKGTTATNLGRLVIDTTADHKTDQKADFPLRYNSDSGESVLLVRDNPNTPPPFLDPCSPSNINSLWWRAGWAETQSNSNAMACTATLGFAPDRVRGETPTTGRSARNVNGAIWR
jgi:hypothetical protein